jgi:hypothetical protein
MRTTQERYEALREAGQNLRTRRYRVGLQEALRLAGLEGERSGRLMMLGARSNNGLGLRRRTHWQFTRKRDGSIETALGRLAGAQVLEINGEVSLVQFFLEGEEESRP